MNFSKIKRLILMNEWILKNFVFGDAPSATAAITFS